MQIKIGINAILGAIAGMLFTRHIIGAIIGFVIGVMSDSNAGKEQGGQRRSPFGTGGYGQAGGQYRQYSQHAVQEQFSKSLLILSAEVMNADGKILKAELDFVKQFLIQQFGQAGAQQYVIQLKTILQQENDIQQTCMNISRMMPTQQRTMLVQYLFGIAQSDGNISKQEINIIERISTMLGIPAYEFSQLKSMFWKDAANSYKVLGIEKNADDRAVKKAYRKMAVENHPDKFATLGEQHQKAANEKFQKIQEAYETIKKERGMV
jgi:DnaJ like chaperone protein